MSQVASEAYAREKRMRSLDTIMVHNITSEDVTLWDDKYGPTRQKLMIPKAQKDIGFGRGNKEMPRYLAERFTKQIIEQVITKQSDESWAARKKELRMLPKAELLQIAETEPTRTNDQASWAELFPRVWLGVVSRYGGEEIPDPQDPMIPDSGNPMVDTMNKLNLADKDYEPNTQTEDN